MVKAVKKLLSSAIPPLTASGTETAPITGNLKFQGRKISGALFSAPLTDFTACASGNFLFDRQDQTNLQSNFLTSQGFGNDLQTKAFFDIAFLGISPGGSSQSVYLHSVNINSSGEPATVTLIFLAQTVAGQATNSAFRSSGKETDHSAAW